jgi:hypothetical protein
VAVLDVVAIPLEGDGPTLPLWGRVVTVVWCNGVSLYSLVNFFGRNVGRDIS